MTVHDRIEMVTLLNRCLPEGYRASESPGVARIIIHNPMGLPMTIHYRVLRLDGRALTTRHKGAGWIGRVVVDVVRAAKRLQPPNTTATPATEED